MKKGFLVGIFIITVLVGGDLMPMTSAVAAPAVSSSVPRALKEFLKISGGKIVHTFPTKIENLIGYAVKSPDGQAVIYGIDGYMMAGELISPQGMDLTSVYERKYLQNKADIATVASEILADPAHIIWEGKTNAPHDVLVFFDPNCIFCHKFYQAIKPLITAGKVRIGWLSVAFLYSTSPGRAATILTAEDPTAELAYNENPNHFDTHTEQGGAPVASKIPTWVKAYLVKNLAYMERLGANGTPTILIKTSTGWQMSVGFSSGILNKILKESQKF